ncbi:MAG: VOC family protein [Pontiella sp.]
MNKETQGCDLPPGTMSWSELITSDKEGCLEFYTQLFGWETENMELPGGAVYTLFKVGERPVAGCFQPDADSKTPPMWLSYVNVADLDATVKKAQELGAAVIKERMDLPMGSFAIISDPQGAVLAFWQGAGTAS